MKDQNKAKDKPWYYTSDKEWEALYKDFEMKYQALKNEHILTIKTNGVKKCK